MSNRGISYLISIYWNSSKNNFLFNPKFTLCFIWSNSEFQCYSLPYSKCYCVFIIKAFIFSLGKMSKYIGISWPNGYQTLPIDEDDICVILWDGRKGHRHNIFYEEYPDLEEEVKAFAFQKCSQKKCSFTVKDLAVFVDQRFREKYSSILEEIGFDSKRWVRLPCWFVKVDAKFEKNSNMPYFKGHESKETKHFRAFQGSLFFPFYDKKLISFWTCL